jgi:hypothetical protein
MNFNGINILGTLRADRLHMREQNAKIRESVIVEILPFY